MIAGIRRQAGATLVVALIMLVVVTLLAVSTLGTTRMNLKVVGNMQSRGEALNAAQQAIEAVISTPLFLANPRNALPDPCGPANALCTDLNGDGTPEYVTRLDPAPVCVSAKAVKESELNLSRAEDLSCAAYRVPGHGVATGDSLCADTAWEITAETRSTFSRTKVTVTQGVAVRVAIADAEALCGPMGAGADARGRQPSAEPEARARGERVQPLIKTRGSTQAHGARDAAGTQSVRPNITQRRRRTYWYTHANH